MKRFLPLTLIFLAWSTLCAQDPQFSQYYQAPLYLNPGFAGLTPQQRLVFNHRMQWPNLPQAFSTYAASYDLFVPELRSGFGVLVTTDKMGSAGWRTTTGSLLYSYKLKITEKLIFSPGLSFGFGTNGLDRSKITLGDGLEYDGLTLDPDVFKLGRQTYFDFASGFLLYSRKSWIGASFAHMNRANLSVLGEESRLPMKTAIHAGIRLDMSGGLRERGRASYLTPSFIYRMQGPTFSQLDVGLNYHVDPISVGVWYRGKPFQKAVNNTIEQDALILFLGLYLKQLNFGYSYDFTISELQPASGGSHEISLIYEFKLAPSRKSTKLKYRLIPCPTFNSTEGFWN